MLTRALALLLAAVPAALAGTLTFVDRWSAVSIEGEIDGAPPPEDYYYASDTSGSFDPFDTAVSDSISWDDVNVVGNAEQMSVLSPTHVLVHGAAYAAIDDVADVAVATAHSQSVFELTFDVDQPTPIELSGHLYLPPGMGPPTPFDAHVRLIHLIDSTPLTLFEVDTEDTPIEFIDTLDPGRYILDAGCNVGGDTTIAEGSTIGSIWFDLDLTVVPEPAAGLFLAAGLILLRPR
jgi:hypothetical protein